MKTVLIPLSAKMFLGFFILITLFLTLIAAFVNSTYAEVLQENEVKYNLLATDKIKEQFNFTVSLIKNMTGSLTGNSNVQRFLIELEQESAVAPGTASQVTALARGALEMQSFVENIHVMSAGGKIVSGADGSNRQRLLDIHGEYMRKATDGEGTEFWNGGRLQPLTYIVPVFRTNPRRVIGLLVLDINYDFIYESFTSSAISANERVMIVDSQGNILFNFPFNVSYAPFLEQHPDILLNPKMQKRATVYGQDSIIVSEEINMADWKIIRLISKGGFTKNTQHLAKILRILLIISLLGGLAYSLWVSHLFTKPIRILTDACVKAQRGDLTTQVDIKSRDELENLGNTFNMMITQLGQSLEKELSDQKRKSQLQFQVLQAQVNPHFLYNTLDSIRWMAVMQGAGNIAEMSVSLINLLKYNLAPPDTNTTLQDEIESVRHYIQIQRFRYADNFDFSDRIAPETQQCAVVRFILQPLVENCIIHGFEDVEKTYQMRISSFISGGRLHVKVIDNGTGMSPERILAVNAGMRPERRYNYIGVQNIRERIQFYFGEEYGLTYSSEPNVGTIAEIILPMLRGHLDEGAAI